MTNEQLVALIRSGEDEAENMLQLWQQNKGFIHKIAKKYSGYAEMDDLTQEGYIGLCEAVRYYDSDQCTSFITYAAFWIRQTMQRYADNCSSVVRLPVHVREDIREYQRAVKEYMKYYGCEPSERELCLLLHIDREKLHAIKQSVRMGQIDSLSRPLAGEDKDLTLADCVASDEELEDDCISRIDREAMRRDLWEEIDNLPDRQQDVIRKRYIQGLTMKETGNCTSATTEEVRNIQAKALRTLRNTLKNKQIREYYELYLSAAHIHHVGVERFKCTWTSEVEREVLGFI